MALSTGLASDLALSSTRRTPTGNNASTMAATPTAAPAGLSDPGWAANAASGGSGQVGDMPAQSQPMTTASPSPQEQAASNAAVSQNSFNLALALATIGDAANMSALNRQSDYYGLLAGMMKQDPTAGYANAQAGLQQAILGIDQEQLGYDANTLRAQLAYTNNLYGLAGQSYNSTNQYLNALANANNSTYGMRIGNYAKWLASINLATNSQMSAAQAAHANQVANYSSDATARGAWGATGTSFSLGNMAQQLASQQQQIKSTGYDTWSRVMNARDDFIKAYKQEVASIANQRASNQQQYAKAGQDRTERDAEINNALAKNALAIQQDNLKKSLAGNQAAQAGATAAWNDSMSALQYQQAQAGVSQQMAQARANDLYTARSMLPAINNAGGNVKDFLAQGGVDPQVMSQMSLPEIRDMATYLNASGLTEGDYAYLGFTPQQLRLFGLTPATTQVAYGGGGRLS